MEERTQSVREKTRGQVCPICQSPISSAIEHNSGDITTLELLCMLGHAWQVKFISNQGESLG